MRPWGFYLIVACFALGGGGCATSSKLSTSAGPWTSPFDGRTLSGFFLWNRPEAAIAGWYVADGEIRLPANAKCGDLALAVPVEDFELTWQFKISANGNSGVKYRVPSSRRGKWPIGCEYQILDDNGHPDAKFGRSGNRKTASLYDVMPAPPDKPLLPPGEWNKARIVVSGSKAEHWLNGRLLVAYDVATSDFKRCVAMSKFAKEADYAVLGPGYILFQDHNDPVAYRDIRLRRLNVK
ncbi:MAG: DUF1080 domain-containing protein [Kiritimatiellia bacterium]